MKLSLLEIKCEMKFYKKTRFQLCFRIIKIYSADFELKVGLNLSVTTFVQNCLIFFFFVTKSVENRFLKRECSKLKANF